MGSYKSKIHALVISATQTYYDGDAYAVSSENDVGSFDVIEGHRNFITIIQHKLLIRSTANDVQEVPITKGVLTVHDNQVRVYVGF